MPIYNVKINPENTVRVEAESEQGSRRKVELDIAATVPDKLLYLILMKFF